MYYNQVIDFINYVYCWTYTGVTNYRSSGLDTRFTCISKKGKPSHTNPTVNILISRMYRSSGLDARISKRENHPTSIQ